MDGAPKRNLRAVGRVAEDRAAEFLAAKGLTIITRRFKCRHGELDLVVLDGDLLVFVEVKLRSEGRPEDTISARKRELLHESAREYLRKAEEPDREYRIDLVAVDRSGIRHYPAALSEF
jgi:putative endonuclease